MYPEFLKNTNFIYIYIYISYYTILYYTRRREPPNVLSTWGGHEISTWCWTDRLAQNQGLWCNTVRSFHLRIYEGPKRYIVTWNGKSLVADRMAPGKASNGHRALCDGAFFLLPGAVKTRFSYKMSQISAPHRGWSNIHDILVIQWPRN